MALVPQVDVKKLPKKPAPARFGRRLTAAQKARATHLCIDCGYVSGAWGSYGAAGAVLVRTTCQPVAMALDRAHVQG